MKQRPIDPLLVAVIDKLPVHDNSWTPELRETWWRLFKTAIDWVIPVVEIEEPSVYDWFEPTRSPPTKGDAE